MQHNCQKKTMLIIIMATISQRLPSPESIDELGQTNVSILRFK